MTTTTISSAIETLVENSQKELFLVSPYLKIHRRLEQLILEKAEKGVIVYIVFGKDKEQPYIKNSPLANSVALFYCDRLHAKCYMNENESLITSMNLYDYSQINNIEFGILSTKRDEAFLASRGEIIRTIKESEPFNKIADGVMHQVSSIENPIFMRDIRRELETARGIKNDEGRFHSEVCRYLMSVHRFPRTDLYQDGSGILAGAVIPRDLYLATLKKFRT